MTALQELVGIKSKQLPSTANTPANSDKVDVIVLMAAIPRIDDGKRLSEYTLHHGLVH